MAVEVYLVDAFTNEIGKGNRAGVVLEGSGLSEQEMLKIAQEVNVSETAFITRVEEGVVGIRFFSVKEEVPICGHATLASFHTLLKEKLIQPGLYKMDCLKGMIDIVVSSDGYIGMIVDHVEVVGNIDAYKKDLLEGLNLTNKDILNESIPIYSTGNPKVVVQVKDESVLDSITINKESLIELSSKIKCSGYHIFALSKEKDILVSSRMFAPSIGIDEDPVTGNSVGCVIQYLFDSTDTKITDLMSCRMKQGQAINKTGYIEVNTIFTPMGIKEITYYGDCVLVDKISV